MALHPNVFKLGLMLHEQCLSLCIRESEYCRINGVSSHSSSDQSQSVSFVCRWAVC